MKSIYYLFLFVLFAYACHPKQDKKAIKTEIKKDSVARPQTTNDHSKEFLDLFKDLSPHKLHIYHPDWIDGEITPSHYRGQKIDLSKYPYFQNCRLSCYIELGDNDEVNVFALGKFQVNDQYMGLIVRQPSQYEEILIQLFFWDKKEKRVLDGLTLADGFGDEGWRFDTESWITEFEFNKKMTIVSRKKDSDINVQNENATTVVRDTLWINRFDGKKFNTELGRTKDTVHYKLRAW